MSSLVDPLQKNTHLHLCQTCRPNSKKPISSVGSADGDVVKGQQARQTLWSHDRSEITGDTDEKNSDQMFRMCSDVQILEGKNLL